MTPLLQAAALQDPCSGFEEDNGGRTPATILLVSLNITVASPCETQSLAQQSLTSPLCRGPTITNHRYGAHVLVVQHEQRLLVSLFLKKVSCP